MTLIMNLYLFKSVAGNQKHKDVITATRIVSYEFAALKKTAEAKGGTRTAFLMRFCHPTVMRNDEEKWISSIKCILEHNWNEINEP